MYTKTDLVFGIPKHQILIAVMLSYWFSGFGKTAIARSSEASKPIRSKYTSQVAKHFSHLITVSLQTSNF